MQLRNDIEKSCLFVDENKKIHSFNGPQMSIIVFFLNSLALVSAVRRHCDKTTAAGGHPILPKQQRKIPLQP
jgi:hypothetical protein